MKPRIVIRLTLFSAVLATAGCSPSQPETVKPAATTEPAFVDVPLGDTGVEFGIGDIESRLTLGITLREGQNYENVQFLPRFTQKGDLAKVDMRVSKPYPDELWLTLGVNSTKNFEGHAVQVKIRVYFDEREVTSYGFIYGANALSDQKRFFVDVLEHFDEPPSTLLVHAKAELNLFLDTDETTITLDTPPTPETQSVVKLSNPVRIDFLP